MVDLEFEILDRFPYLNPRESGSNFFQYIDEHQQSIDDIEVDITEVKESHQVDNASGDELDHIGTLFGPLGKRRGRSDDEYQSFLKSLTQSFDGTGTIPGMKRAIAAGLNIQPEDVTITEHFEDLEYSVQIDSWNQSHSTTVLRRMAELSDASVADIRDALTYRLLGEGTVGMEGSDTTSNTISSDGLGTSTLGNDTLGDS